MVKRLSLLILLAGCLEPFPVYEDYLVEADAAVATAFGEIENDCNGRAIPRTQADGQPCQNPLFGICRATGTWQCLPEGVVCVVTDPPQPQEEICPDATDAVSQDEDCDGRTDEGCVGCPEGTQQSCYPGVESEQGTGECTLGRRTCGANGEYGPCEGAGSPSAEACDGLDNDCDGITDEGETGDGTFPCTDSCGVGRAICVDGTILNCDAAGQPEACNNQDDDCDGVVDEDVPELGEACTVTPAVNSCSIGRQTCNGGIIGCELDPNAACPCQPLNAVSDRHFICGNRLDYDRANQMCASSGLGTLLTVETSTETRAVFHALKSINLQENVWLGATRDGNGVRWTSGQAGYQTLINPTSLNNAGAGSQRVQFESATGLWSFVPFSTQNRFICERACSANDQDQDGFATCNGDCNDNDPNIHPAKPEFVGDGIDNNCNGLLDETTHELCGDSADNDGDGDVDEDPCLNNCRALWSEQRAALVCSNWLEWNDARERCEAWGSRLAEFKTPQSWRQVWAWLSESHTPDQTEYWFGLRRVGTNRFEYVSGETIDPNSPIWSNWAAGQPDNYGGEDSAQLWCSTHRRYGNDCSGTWNDADGEDNESHFICWAPE